VAEVCVSLWGVAGARGRVLSPPPAREMSDVCGNCFGVSLVAKFRVLLERPMGDRWTFLSRVLSRDSRRLSREIQIHGFRIANKTLDCGADALWSSFSHESRVILNYSLHAL